MKLFSKRRVRDRKGQASIMMGILMMTFLFFFAFVVNVGMLVNAKINLQNAADLAAYAGAAVQARQLTQISYLNYEMRRQYKKFLFRYYVLGNMAQDYFPRNGGGGKAATPMQWIPDAQHPNNDYKAPVVCMIWKSNDNPCRVQQVPKIEVPKATGFDAINDTLSSVLSDIQRTAGQNCVKMGSANVLVLNTWLWNTDPDFSQTLADPNTDPNASEVLAVAKGLARGIGLIPREILLKRRIDTLAEYVNQAPNTAVDLSKVNTLGNPDNIPEPAANERTIQAFYSAYYTLGNHLFPNADLKLDEVMPPELLRLVPIDVQFNAYAIQFNFDPNNGCTATRIQDGVKTGIPMGVYKDTSLLTYYAIRLKSTARLMFSPFGDLELSAYSAAQPFGSRIGPVLSERDFVRPNTITVPEGSGGPPTTGSNLPNLPIRDDNDTSGQGAGWDTKEAMGALFQAFNPPGAAASGQVSTGNSIDEPGLARAYHVAMAPNVYEATRYNIPYDGDDPFLRNFDSNHMMSFWAPIFPLSKMGSMDSELKSLLTRYVGDGTADQQAALDRAKKQFQTYLSKLVQGIGEPYDRNAINVNGCVNCEGFKIVRLADPMNTRPPAGEVRPIAQSPGASFAVSDPSLLRSSWADVWDGDVAAKGRIGYSVKFVSFKYLSGNGGKVETTQGQNARNLLYGDEQLQQDLQFIKH